MEELSVSSGPNFVNDGGLQIDEDGARNVFTGPSLGEESVKRIVTTADSLVRWHLKEEVDGRIKMRGKNGSRGGLRGKWAGGMRTDGRRDRSGRVG